MAAKKREKLAKRREEKNLRRKNRIPQQPAGMPRGMHVGGMHGKKSIICLCGGCYEKNKDQIVYQEEG